MPYVSGYWSGMGADVHSNIWTAVQNGIEKKNHKLQPHLDKYSEVWLVLEDKDCMFITPDEWKTHSQGIDRKPFEKIFIVNQTQVMCIEIIKSSRD
jgi:hypothetical protein